LRDHLFDVSQRIGRAQQAAFRPARVGLMIAGLEVPHLHLHVVPIDGVHDLDFSNAAHDVDPAELEAAAEAIRAELRSVAETGVFPA
jgi:histidine triad (HIT) family protein